MRSFRFRSTTADRPVSPSDLRFLVSGMTCAHCTASVAEEIRAVAGVRAVEVDLETMLADVHGTGVSEAAVGAAIAAAGYEGVPA